MKKQMKKLGGFLSLLGVVVLAGCGAKDAVIDSAAVAGDAMEKTGEVMAEKTEEMADVVVEAVTEEAVSITVSLDLSYTAPPGNEEMSVEIDTDASGIITAVRTEPGATHTVSKKNQAAFSRDIEATVVGKNIAGLQVDVVGGASLTTGGFNAALAKL